jgi:hypothetical protein
MSQSVQALRGKSSLTIAVLFVVLLASAVGLVRYVPTIVVDKMLASDIQINAGLWEQRVINRVSSGTEIFKTQKLTKQDSEFLRGICSPLMGACSGPQMKVKLGERYRTPFSSMS